MRTANGVPTTCWSPTTAIVTSSFAEIPLLAPLESKSTKTQTIAAARRIRLMVKQFTTK
jgi:hypothetical protein